MAMLAPLETLIFEGIAAEQRLRELGLSSEGLLEVIGRGEQARAEATANDPVNAAGWDAYRYRVRALRDIYGHQGWEPETREGLELLGRDDGKVAVVTRSGDEGVGIRGAVPQPSRSVGDSTRSATSAQLALDPNWLNTPLPATRGTRLYMLLVYATPGLVRAELSLPTSWDDDGMVTGWIERILLPDLDLTDPGVTRTVPAPEPIDVPVARKR
jgi:hypothetical protein